MQCATKNTSSVSLISVSYNKTISVVYFSFCIIFFRASWEEKSMRRIKIGDREKNRFTKGVRDSKLFRNATLTCSLSLAARSEKAFQKKAKKHEKRTLKNFSRTSWAKIVFNVTTISGILPEFSTNQNSWGCACSPRSNNTECATSTSPVLPYLSEGSSGPLGLRCTRFMTFKVHERAPIGNVKNESNCLSIPCLVRKTSFEYCLFTCLSCIVCTVWQTPMSI